MHSEKNLTLLILSSKSLKILKIFCEAFALDYEKNKLKNVLWGFRCVQNLHLTVKVLVAFTSEPKGCLFFSNLLAQSLICYDPLIIFTGVQSRGRPI